MRYRNPVVPVLFLKVNKVYRNLYIGPRGDLVEVGLNRSKRDKISNVVQLVEGVKLLRFKTNGE